MKLNIVKQIFFTILYNYLVIFSLCNFMNIYTVCFYKMYPITSTCYNIRVAELKIRLDFKK